MAKASCICQGRAGQIGFFRRAIATLRSSVAFSNYGTLSRKYAHRLPFIVKLNHNELLSYPKEYDQTMFASLDPTVEQTTKFILS